MNQHVTPDLTAHDPAVGRAPASDTEKRLSAILETAVEGIITIDSKGTIESANPAAERIFGYSAAELVGRNVSMLMPPPHRQAHDGYLENYLHTGQAKIIGVGREVIGLRKDGTLFPMDLSVSEVRLATRITFSGFIRDISQRKKDEAGLAKLAQALLEKNKELETIVYVASHDLRSPLVNIQGFSRELAHSCQRLLTRLSDVGVTATDREASSLLTSEIPEALDYIQAGVAKIDMLLSGFLRYSRLGRVAINPQPINMHRLVSGVVKTFEFQVQQAGATVELHPMPDCVADPTQMNQVFSNLIDNALKYLDPARRGLIELSGVLTETEIIYTVRDNGIGIAADHQKNVFEIFHRLNPSHSSGEGLGLTIAQRIMERHGGRIRVESAEGEGSAFFVSLPAPGQVKLPA